MIEVLETLLTLLVCWCLFVVSRLWWKSHLNPVALGVLAWTPALVMLNWPPYFLSPVYIHLNRPIYSLTYVALAIAFLSFWAGCAVVKAVSKPLAFEVVPARLALRADPARMLAVFAVGLGIFLYAYVQSGLMNVSLPSRPASTEPEAGSSVPFSFKSSLPVRAPSMRPSSSQSASNGQVTSRSS